MQTPKNSFESFLREWGLTNLHEQASTQVFPPTFPTFTELVALDAENAHATKQDRGLFDALIGRPEPLYEDSLEHPDKYRPEAQELLRDLVSGVKRELSDNERKTLDLATIDFATASREKPRSPGRPRARTETASTQPVAGVDVPTDAVQPYWWLQ